MNRIEKQERNRQAIRSVILNPAWMDLILKTQESQSVFARDVYTNILAPEGW